MNQRTVYPCERAGQMRRNSFAGVKIKDERDIICQAKLSGFSEITENSFRIAQRTRLSVDGEVVCIMFSTRNKEMFGIISTSLNTSAN